MTVETKNVALAVVGALVVGGGLAFLPTWLADDTLKQLDGGCTAGDVGIVAPNKTNADGVSVSDGWVTWYEDLAEDGPEGGGDVFAYNDSRGEIVTVADGPARQTVNELWGSTVVWIEFDRPDGPDRLRAMDLGTGETWVLNTSRNMFAPRGIWQDRVLVEAGHGLGVYNLTTDIYTPIKNGSVGVTEIWGDRVVWVDSEKDKGNRTNRLVLHNLDTAANRTLLETRHSLSDPAIHRDLVVYMKGSRVDDPSSTWDIYAYNISTGTETPIATGDEENLAQTDPRIDGDWIAYIKSGTGTRATAMAHHHPTDTTRRINEYIGISLDVWQNKLAFIEIDEATSNKHVALACLEEPG